MYMVLYAMKGRNPVYLLEWKSHSTKFINIQGRIKEAVYTVFRQNDTWREEVGLYLGKNNNDDNSNNFING